MPVKPITEVAANGLGNFLKSMANLTRSPYSLHDDQRGNVALWTERIAIEFE
jgi:hypothetical protein